MPKKPTNPKKSQNSHVCKSALCHPSTWLIVVLTLALFTICGISAYGFEKFDIKTDIDSAKLAVFDHIISDEISRQEINSERPSYNEATGYGISDEDGVFYVTFDFVYYDDGTQPPQYSDVHHGILYFWPDAEHNTYSHAFSYHDDYYHPGGTYVEIGNHYLRDLPPDSNE